MYCQPVTVGRGAKGTEIGDSGTPVRLTWVTFDGVVSQ